MARLLLKLGEHNLRSYGSTGLDDAPPEEWHCAFVAYDGAQPVGLIAIRPLDEAAHIVRLYVDTCARGRGLAVRLATVALDEARAAGYASAVCDTGTEAPAVLTISAQLGARLVPPFGPHANGPDTRCFELPLDSRGT